MRRERWHTHNLAHGGDSAMLRGCARGGLLMAPSQRPPAVRLGWCVADPAEWRNERGEPIDLRVIAPSEVERQVRATATRMAEIEMTDKYGRLHHRDGSMQLEPVPEEAFNRPGRQRAHLRITRKVLKSRAKDALTWKQEVVLRGGG